MRETHKACEGAKAKLMKASSASNELAELCKRQVKFGVSVQKLTAEMEEVKLQLVAVRSEEVELFTNLIAVERKYKRDMKSCLLCEVLPIMLRTWCAP